MKKAGQIILLVITILMGIFLLMSFVSVLLAFFLELLSITFAFGGEVLLSELYRYMMEQAHMSGDGSVIAIVVSLLTSIFGIIVATVWLISSLGSLLIDLAFFVLFIVATSIAFKAKTKKQLIFPAVVTLIYGGLTFLAQQYITAAICIVPGIMFLTCEDENAKENKEKSAEVKVETKEETPIEKVDPEVVS